MPIWITNDVEKQSESYCCSAFEMVHMSYHHLLSAIQTLRTNSHSLPLSVSDIWFCLIQPSKHDWWCCSNDLDMKVPTSGETSYLPPHPPPPKKDGTAKSPPRCFPGWRGVRFQGPLTWPRHPLAPVDLDVGRYFPPGNWGQKCATWRCWWKESNMQA